MKKDEPSPDPGEAPSTMISESATPNAADRSRSDKASHRERQRRLDDLIRQTKGLVTRASDLEPRRAKPRRFLPADESDESDGSDRSVRSSKSDEEAEFDLGIADEFPPGNDSRLLREFFPGAEALGPSSGASPLSEAGASREAGPSREDCLAWRLRTEVALDGSPTPQGVRMPLAARVLEDLDMTLGRIFDPQAMFGQLGVEDVTYLDIESTGLSGGVGVYAFLVALGFFEGERFVVEQYFMEDFPGEPTMLDALVRRIAEFKGLVTYNGKAFDVPFLTVRGAMTRVAMPFATMPHLDLLHAARRIWRGRLASCSLGSIERDILGVLRESDVPGSLIPRIYLEYVRGIRRRQIVPVVDHNVQDVVSMPALFALLCRYFRDPEGEDLQHRATQAGLAAWFRRAGRREDAIRCLERAALLSRSPVDEHSLSMRVAVEYRRDGRQADAVEIWRERARIAPGLLGVGPCIEMAKHCEHREKDCAQALEWTRRALERLGEPAISGNIAAATPSSQGDTPRRTADAGTDPEPDSESVELQEAEDEAGLVGQLRHRLRRLERRLARQDKRQNSEKTL